ncbi:MAG: helix-turn-helix transcriptional regulator [Clostridiales bacterium]|nr:helix-turn-helix transcriptional regulator [Clostridiales bacterium]
MLKLRILEILEEQGKTKYWLCKRLEMTYTNFNNIVNNNTSSIKFDTLERISNLLEVPVGELFEQTRGESDM